MSESKGHILVIDDSEAVLSQIKAALKAGGYEVTTTTQTVGSARHLLSADLVLLDFHMPGIDGQTVLRSLRTAAQSLPVPPPIYLYTSDREIAERAQSLGFDGAFSDKGHMASLVAQTGAALRMAKMKRRSPTSK